jgi:curved DNA-binding protein CbpA
MKDYYAILHVLPSAEIDVIKAAYKALARKYHPDTFEGDKAYASKRMQEINDAFGVIGDPEKRKKYDAERKAANQEDEFTSNGDEPDARLEEDWKVACKYCPEAADCFIHLNKLSRSLAFAFKSYLLDSKQFSASRTIRDKFRAEFLNNYFGTNPTVQEIGEILILSGELEAARSVNKAAKVLGASLDIAHLVQSLERDFHNLGPILKSFTSQSLTAQKLFKELQKHKHDLFVYENSLRLSEELMKTLGIAYKKHSVICYYQISYEGTESQVTFRNTLKWIINNLGKHPLLKNAQ